MTEYSMFKGKKIKTTYCLFGKIIEVVDRKTNKGQRNFQEIKKDGNSNPILSKFSI